MTIKKIGLLREGKVPPDKRVALSPQHAKQFVDTYPEIDLVVQPSPIRCFPDEDYEKLGIKLQEDLSDCDVLIGVKEVNVEDLIPNKTYLFFSHTYKKQPYNKKLLRAILDKNISLIDYEMLTDSFHRRLIGFGRYAGVVGAYNGFLTWGKKFTSFQLKPAHECFDRAEMEQEYSKINLPDDFKLVITGSGRVANGAMEVIDAVGLKKVSPDEFKNKSFNEPVYTKLGVSDYYALDSGEEMDVQKFYQDPSNSHSVFPEYAKHADAYFSCHFWDNRAPYIFTREEAKADDFKLKVVADISCDIDCAVACTLRPSTIADPIYGYDAKAEKETSFRDEDAIAVMAVDNLPCELPRDASEDFGEELLKHILPSLIGIDEDGRIMRARETTLDGKLTAKYAYLQEWVDEKD